jgi:hypothetical protein
MVKDENHRNLEGVECMDINILSAECEKVLKKNQPLIPKSGNFAFINEKL